MTPSFAVPSHLSLKARLVMKTFRTVGLIFAALLAMPTLSFAQAAAAQSEPALAASTWTVTLDGDARTRTLVIANVSPKTDGGLQLEATYGWSDKTKRDSVKAELNNDQLVLITPADAKIVATKKADGAFHGTFVSKAGNIKSVIISRAEMNGSPTVAYQKPGADVPENCAAYVGVWSGEWPRIGQTWLWIPSVDKACNAKYAYGVNPNPPKSFKTAGIKGSSLSFDRPSGGTVTFELRDDTLVARYSGPEGVNNATFQRARPDVVAALGQ